MPELPEIETIRLGLQSKIVGLKIKKIQILNPKTFTGDPKLIEGAKIVKVWRRAKVLGIDLSRHPGGPSPIGSKNKDAIASLQHDEEWTLLFHLKMSGQLIFQGKEKFIGGHPTRDMTLEMPNKSTRVIFELEPVIASEKRGNLVPDSKTDSGLPSLARMTGEGPTSFLYFNDQRKFGWIKLTPYSSLLTDNFLSKLGPEPLEKEFTWQILKQNLLKHSNQPVKVALLDQSVVSGVGNIYACEGCFNAKIDPKTKISKLTDNQFKSLHAGVVQALKDGIKHGGSSKTHFVSESGKKGLFLDYAYVYSRENEPCKICGTKIKKIKLGGRGTFFCPNCQN